MIGGRPLIGLQFTPVGVIGSSPIAPTTSRPFRAAFHFLRFGPDRSERLERTKPPPKELLLRIRRRRTERPFYVAARFLIVPGASMQLAEHGIPQIVSKQPRRRLNGLQEGKPRLGPFTLSDGDGAVHRVQR